MIIEFDFTKRDLIEFYYLTAHKNPKLKTRNLERLGYYSISLLFISFGLFGHNFILFGLGITILGFSIHEYISLRKKIIKEITLLEKENKLGPFIGKKKLEIEVSGLRLIDNQSDTLYYWNKEFQINLIDSFICVKINEIHLPIPKRAFRDNLEVHTFINELNSNLKLTNNPPI